MSVGRALALLALSALAVSAEVLVNPLPLSDWTNGSAIFWGGPQVRDPKAYKKPPRLGNRYSGVHGPRSELDPLSRRLGVLPPCW